MQHPPTDFWSHWPLYGLAIFTYLFTPISILLRAIPYEIHNGKSPEPQPDLYYQLIVQLLSKDGNWIINW